VRAACLKTCQDEPFTYTSLQAVLAWALAEAGANTTLSASRLSRTLPLNALLFLEQMLRSAKTLEDNDPCLVSGHHLCAAVNSYRLVPYAFLLAVALALAVLLLRIALAVFFSVFTGAFAVFLPSFTR